MVSHGLTIGQVITLLLCYLVPVFHARDLISKLKSLDKEYDSMFQAYDGHCVTSCGEMANLEYLNKQDEFLEKYLFN